MDKNKEAILVVSFGTSHKDTREKTIEAIEKRCMDAYPDIEVRRAFTSGMIMKVLKERDQIFIDNVAEAMERLVNDGYQKITLQPTHILNGDEYEKMVGQAEAYRDKVQSLEIGAPLLTTSKDYEDLCHAMAKHTEELVDEDGLLVLMGHGTGHFTDSSYAALEYRFHALGYKNVLVGTVEGYPDFEVLVDKIKSYNPKSCTLYPLMVVAGEHAKNDMAGDEDSWKTELESLGYKVRCVMEGIGEIPAVQEMYVDHLREAVNR